jgi:sugar phosphate isomerase/epimerase
MAAVAAMGCTTVQPWIVDVEYTPCFLDPDVGSEHDRLEAQRAAEALGITFSGFCAQLKGSNTYGGLDEEDGLAWRIAKTNRALTAAAEMGGPLVTTHVGVIPDDTTSIPYQTLLRSVGEIARHAEKVGVFFAPETGQESPEALLRFIETIGNPYLKVNYDPCNLLRYGSQEGVVDGVKVLREYIVHSHAKDWNPETGRATCGEGLVPWPDYISALADIGYDGVFAIEDETGIADIIESLAASAAFLKQF